MEVMERAVSGGTLHGDEFENACTFFERLTSIPVRGNASTVGYLATDETREDVARLKRWYSDNRDRLVWNEAEHRIDLSSQPAL